MGGRDGGCGPSYEAGMGEARRSQVGTINEAARRLGCDDEVRRQERLRGLMKHKPKPVERPE